LHACLLSILYGNLGLDKIYTSVDSGHSALPCCDSSYIIGRSHTARLGNSTSSTLYCSSGVPQGSVLGPILFLINVSPVYHIAQSLTISHQQYADDILLYIALSASQPHSGIQRLYTLSLNTRLSINGLSTLQMQAPYFSLLASALRNTFLLIHTFRGGDAGRPGSAPLLKVRPSWPPSFCKCNAQMLLTELLTDPCPLLWPQVAKP
jgi:Reverse transcriptase (RNA-dependent DNA polymerase)